MGNVLLDDYKKDDPLQSFDKWLQQNPELAGKQILSQNKLFLTSCFKYSSKQIILKVYFKRDQGSIVEYLKVLLSLKIILIELLNNFVINTKKQMCKSCSIKYIKFKIDKIKKIRQFDNGDKTIFCTNIIIKNPESSILDIQLKKQLNQLSFILEWLIFQMIMALDIVHNQLDIYHGNIRTSNFLSTSYEYLFLTDFANYKPTYILEDTEQGLAEFRLFYSSSLQKCTIAPEKLQGRNESANKIKKPEYIFNLYKQINIDQKDNNKSSSSSINIDSKKIQYYSHMNDLKQMDLFSLGLSILQVLNDGKTTFTYQNLLNLKKNKFNIEQLIDNIINSQKVSSEIQLNKMKFIVKQLLINRKNNQNYQKQLLNDKFKDIMKDQVYILLWYCLSSFTKVSFQLSDHRIYLLQSIIQFIQKQIKKNDYKFIMKRAKCLQNFAALRTFTQLIKKKIIFSSQIQPNSIIDKLINSFTSQKKDQSSNIIQSDEQMDKQNQNQRQSFFINQAKKKTINRRLSFRQVNIKKQKILCPHQFDQKLMSLSESKVFQIRQSKLSAEQRRKNKLYNYIKQQKQLQAERQQLKIQKSLFYSDYQLVIKIVFSCIRNCRYIASKMVGIQLINILSRQSKDQTLLRVVIPFLIQLSQDSDLNVSKYALNSLLDTFYNFIDAFQTQQDTAYYQILIDFFLNTIKSSKTRIFLFTRFKQIYNICEWLQVGYLKFHVNKLNNMNEKLPQQLTKSQSIKQRQSNMSINSQQNVNNNDIKNKDKSLVNFYKLVDHLKIYYGTFSAKQIQVLMQNIPIAILPEMFQFYISFLNTQKIMGLKCSLFIANNASKQFQMQKNIIQVFDNCMQTALSDNGVALYYAIIYFTIRKNTTIDIVHKISRHIINPYLWVREQAYNYIKICLQQYPPTKIFLIFRDIFQPPFPLTLQNLQENILLPEPLKDIDVDFKQRKFTNRISRKIALTQKKFIQYLKEMKITKQNNKNKVQEYQIWQQLTKKFRFIDTNINKNINQVDNFTFILRKTMQQLYQNNFFYYVFSLKIKYNSSSQKQKQAGLQKMYDNLKKLSKFTLDTKTVTEQQRQFFDNLFTSIINFNFQNLLTKHSQEITPDKLKLSLSINIIAEQLYIFNQLKIKPSSNYNGLTNNNKLNIQKSSKPRGIQISQIYQNKDQISKLITVGDLFFISAGHEGIMRVYNTKSIQMNIVTQSQASYQVKSDTNNDQKVKINDMVCLQNTYTAIVATNKGQIKGFQIQRMPGKIDSKNYNKSQNQTEIFKYNINSDIQKLITLKTDNSTQCISYVTSQSILGIQDIRCKQISMRYNLGKQRGYCLSLASNDRSSILVGTVDGYLMSFDIRFNLISSILQLYKDDQSVPITNIVKVKNQKTFAVTYPANNYQFGQFNLQSSQIHIEPSRFYCGNLNTTNNNKDDENIASIPYFINRTNEQVFKLCNNNIMKHIYYSQLSKFDSNLKILDYVSQPLTLKQSKIRQIWANGCRHRYNQILSIYNKKSLPFIQYLNSGGILTNLNPHLEAFKQRNQVDYSMNNSIPKQLTLLVDKKDNQSKSYNNSQSSNSQIDRVLINKFNKIKISHFDQQQNKQFYTNCSIVNGFVAVACKNSKIKIFK